MSEHHPSIRIFAKNGRSLLREGVSITFYMRHSHQEIASQVERSLDAYLRAVGPQALGWYASEEGEWLDLDEAGWALTRRKFLEGPWASIHLRDTMGGGCRYRFEYTGKALAALPPAYPEAVSAVSFWLPTEYLEAHGPGYVRELALELGALLPFCSGHAGLSFNGDLDLAGVFPLVVKQCFRYPGLDMPVLDRHAWQLGTRVRGPAWLTFLGQPVLGELGGVARLRECLHTPGTTVQELAADRAVITLGSWPEAGDTEQGNTLPAYRELARVLEPWLFHQRPLNAPSFPPEAARRWERRFLD